MARQGNKGGSLPYVGQYTSTCDWGQPEFTLDPSTSILTPQQSVAFRNAFIGLTSSSSWLQAGVSPPFNLSPPSQRYFTMYLFSRFGAFEQDSITDVTVMWKGIIQGGRGQPGSPFYCGVTSVEREDSELHPSYHLQSALIGSLGGCNSLQK